MKRGSKETGRVAEIEQPLRLSEFFESWEKAPEFAGDPRVAEFVDLAGRAATLKSRKAALSKNPEGSNKD